MHGFLIKEQVVSNSQIADSGVAQNSLSSKQQVERFLDRELDKNSSPCFDPANLLVNSES